MQMRLKNVSSDEKALMRRGFTIEYDDNGVAIVKLPANVRLESQKAPGYYSLYTTDTFRRLGHVHNPFEPLGGSLTFLG